MTLDPSLWRDRRVLVTGHTGFKGAWLALWLERLGARVSGVALAPEGDGAYGAVGPAGADHRVDICDADALGRAVAEAEPEIVFHLAAQALVRRGYKDPMGTWATNVLGTLNVLEATRDDAVAVVVVTSDKVYANDGLGRAFRESDPLGGHDPYSASKAATELATHSWVAARRHGSAAVATARAGNVVGGGDVGEDRLVPDALRALDADATLRVRHPQATRPWQHVLDPLLGYLVLAQTLVTDQHSAPTAVNFGPAGEELDVAAVVDMVFEEAGRGRWEVDGGDHPPEAPTLRVDPSLAAERLGWHTLIEPRASIAWTMAWEAARRQGADMRAFSLQQISAYEALAGIVVA